jgi:hypothetical protein
VRQSVAKRILDQNYLELSEYIDGDLETNPVFICRESRKQEEGFEVLRLLHNYLSSLYSLNEAIRVLFDQYTTDEVSLGSGAFASTDTERPTVYYTRQLAFLYGLRTDFQHGGFSCFEFSSVGNLGDFVGYHITFDRTAFIEDSGLRDPSRFLRHTTARERRHPLCFIGSFHENTLLDFYEDTIQWFDSA